MLKTLFSKYIGLSKNFLGVITVCYGAVSNDCRKVITPLLRLVLVLTSVFHWFYRIMRNHSINLKQSRYCYWFYNPDKSTSKT